MNCKNCGKHIPDDSNFCQYCRTQVREGALPSEAIPSTGITCPQCGSHDLQVVADVQTKGFNGKKMFLGSSATTSGCCGISGAGCCGISGVGALLGAGVAGFSNLASAICCSPLSLFVTVPTTLLTGLGCAQLSATTSIAAATTSIAAGTTVGAAVGMHRAGETHTEHFWVCKRCGQKFKV